jgi:hypothetical protein
MQDLKFDLCMKYSLTFRYHRKFQHTFSDLRRINFARGDVNDLKATQSFLDKSKSFCIYRNTVTFFFSGTSSTTSMQYAGSEVLNMEAIRSSRCRLTFYGLLGVIS